MPEGDTVFHTAAKLRDALAGKDVDAMRCSGAAVRHRRPDRPAGRRGGQPRQAPVHPGRRRQHPLALEDGRQLADQPGEQPRRAAQRIRIILEAGDIQAAASTSGYSKFLPATTTGRGRPSWPRPARRRLGSAGAAANLAADPDRPLAEALLDQRVMAGVGNVYCNELCFVFGHLPTAPVAAVADPLRMVQRARDMMWPNGSAGTAPPPEIPAEGNELWVYGRPGHLPPLRHDHRDRQRRRRARHLLVPGLSAAVGQRRGYGCLAHCPGSGCDGPEIDLT